MLFLDQILSLLLDKQMDVHNTHRALKKNLKEILIETDQYSNTIMDSLDQQLVELQFQLLEDAEATKDFDPAAESSNEVMESYPGFYAVAVYRVAHLLYQLSVDKVPRMLSEIAHNKTGIDIHPMATIGARLVIDHGTGLVIGATAIVGNDVKLYHGVTLGTKSVKRSEQGIKRHPTLEDNVIVYANASILGGGTTIGAGSTIGGHVILDHSVPDFSLVINDTTPIIKTKNKLVYAQNI